MCRTEFVVVECCPKLGVFRRSAFVMRRMNGWEDLSTAQTVVGRVLSTLDIRSI